MFCFLIYLISSTLPPRKEATIIEIPEYWDPENNYVVEENKLQNKYVIFTGSFANIEIRAENLRMRGLVVENNCKLNFVAENGHFLFDYFVCRNEITFSKAPANFAASKDLVVTYDFYLKYKEFFDKFKVNLGVEFFGNHSTVNMYKDYVMLQRPGFDDVTLKYEKYNRITLYLGCQMNEILPKSNTLDSMPDICFSNPEITYAFIPIIWFDNKVSLSDPKLKSQVTKVNAFTEISFESDNILPDLFEFNSTLQLSTDIYQGVYHIVEDGIQFSTPNTIYTTGILNKSIYPFKKNMELIVHGFNHNTLTLDKLSWQDLSLTIRSANNLSINLNLANLQCSHLRISRGVVNIKSSSIKMLTIPDTTNITYESESVVKFDTFAFYGYIDTLGKPLFVNSLVTNIYVYDRAMKLLQNNPNLEISLSLMDYDHLPTSVEFYDKKIDLIFYKARNLSIDFNIFKTLKIDLTQYPVNFQVDFLYKAAKNNVFDRNFVFTGHGPNVWTALLPLDWKNIQPKGLSVSLQSETLSYYKTIEDYSVPDGIFDYLNVYYQGSSSGKYCILSDRVLESQYCNILERQIVYTGGVHTDKFWTTPEELNDDISLNVVTDSVFSSKSMDKLFIEVRSSRQNITAVLKYEDDFKPTSLIIKEINFKFEAPYNMIELRDFSVWGKGKIDFDGHYLKVLERFTVESYNYASIAKSIRNSSTALLELYFIGLERSINAHTRYIYIDVEVFDDIYVWWSDFYHIHFHLGEFFEDYNHPLKIRFEYAHHSMIENMFEIYGGIRQNYIIFPSYTGQEDYLPASDKGKFTSFYNTSNYTFQTFSGLIPDTIFEFTTPFSKNVTKNASYCLARYDFTSCPIVDLQILWQPGEIVEFSKFGEKYWDSFEIYVQGSSPETPLILGPSFANFSIQLQCIGYDTACVQFKSPKLRRISTVRVHVIMEPNAVVEFLSIGFISNLLGGGNLTGTFFVTDFGISNVTKLCSPSARIFYEIDPKINKLEIYQNYFVIGDIKVENHGKNFFLRYVKPNTLTNALQVTSFVENNEMINYFPNFKFENNFTFYMNFDSTWDDKTYKSPYPFDIIAARNSKIFVTANFTEIPSIFNIPQVTFYGRDTMKVCLQYSAETSCPNPWVRTDSQNWTKLNIETDNVLFSITKTFWDKHAKLAEFIDNKNVHIIATRGFDDEYLDMNFNSLKSLRIDGELYIDIVNQNSKIGKLILENPNITFSNCVDLQPSELDITSDAIDYFKYFKFVPNTKITLRLLNPLNTVKLSYGFLTVKTNTSEEFRFDYDIYSGMTLHALCTHLTLDYNGTQNQTVPFLPEIILTPDERHTWVKFTDRWNIHNVVAESLGTIKKPPTESITYYTEYTDYPMQAWNISGSVMHKKRLGFYCLVNHINQTINCPFYAATIDLTKMTPSIDKLVADENNVVKLWTTANEVRISREFFKHSLSLHGSLNGRGNYIIEDGDFGGNKAIFKNSDVLILGQTLKLSDLLMINSSIVGGSTSISISGNLEGYFHDICSIEPYLISAKSTLIEFTPGTILLAKESISVNSKSKELNLKTTKLGTISFRSIYTEYVMIKVESDYDYTFDMLTVGNSTIFLDPTLYRFKSSVANPKLSHIFGTLILTSNMLEAPKTFNIPVQSSTVIYRFIPPRTPLFTLHPTYYITPFRTPAPTSIPEPKPKFKIASFIYGCLMTIDLCVVVLLALWLRRQWVLAGLGNMRPLSFSSSIEMETSARSPEERLRTYV